MINLLTFSIEIGRQVTYMVCLKLTQGDSKIRLYLVNISHVKPSIAVFQKINGPSDKCQTKNVKSTQVIIPY